MGAVDAFGTAAVTTMAVAYALEGRAAGYVLLFAAGCLASSAYAVAIGSWPFAAVELLWAGVAGRVTRWDQP